MQIWEFDEEMENWMWCWWFMRFLLFVLYFLLLYCAIYTNCWILDEIYRERLFWRFWYNKNKKLLKWILSYAILIKYFVNSSKAQLNSQHFYKFHSLLDNLTKIQIFSLSKLVRRSLKCWTEAYGQAILYKVRHGYLFFCRIYLTKISICI